MLVGFGRRAWAQLADGAPGTPRSAGRSAFRSTPSGPVATGAVHRRSDGADHCNTVSRRVLISGVLVPRRGVARRKLSALCLTCPHEQCKVDLVTDPARLARLTGGTATHPLFECGCHASVFDAARDGARIAGETPRGLYRFRISGVTEGLVEIREIEEAAVTKCEPAAGPPALHDAPDLGKDNA